MKKRLGDCQLIDLGFQGPKFTWCNKRLGANHVKERIDRALANSDFCDEFINVVVSHIEPVGSDHHLLNALIKWDKKIFPNARKLVDELTAQLERCNSRVMNEESKREVESLIKEIEDAWDREEKYWWQRSRVNCWLRNIEVALQFIEKKVSAADNDLLEREFSMEEIKSAVFQLNGAKAPRPDGFSRTFYQAAWGVVSEEVVQMWVNLDQLVSDFAYKIVSKILANRMKMLLSRIISEHQRAFVAGRLIQDNILIAHEAFQYLKNKKKGKKVEMAIKIDMNKAYDKLEWKFVEEVMRRLGFGERWIA
ncbi:uncharacterized protein LOC114716394 [Neltuma alba]|uniref:uncharacterized protein LOC114716394 n=1 Tax=Neltuma alba TaxID=207710 RepID=UPI0010A4DCFC|nr:uncharacterized protein LOC114716394 [Prosopis alba]